MINFSSINIYVLVGVVFALRNIICRFQRNLKKLLHIGLIFVFVKKVIYIPISNDGKTFFSK